MELITPICTSLDFFLKPTLKQCWISNFCMHCKEEKERNDTVETDNGMDIKVVSIVVCLSAALVEVKER